MPGISYAYAEILGVFLECVMYGIFVTLLIAACYVQWERFLNKGKINHLMASATVFYGLSVTTNVVISFYQVIQAILQTPPGMAVHLTPGPPCTVTSLVWFFILQLQSTVADIIVAYRMYHIYHKNPFVCIIPSVTVAGLIATGCILTYQMQATPLSEKALTTWSTASFCFSIFNSFFLTAAISIKLWCVHRQTVKAGIQVDDPLVLRVMRASIESAALWTVFSLINFMTNLAKSSLTYTFLAVAGPVLGISFCLIIVRLGHISLEARDETWHGTDCTTTSQPSEPSPISLSFAQGKVRRDTSPSEPEDFPMGALESQKQEYVNSPCDLPNVIRASISLSVPG